MIEISLILPLYNQLQNLDTIMSSVRYQKNIDREKFEVVVIDDGLNDGLDAKLDEYRESLNIQCVSHECNKGRAAARNSGVAIARGDILVFNDGDRFLSPNFLHHHSIFHKENEKSMLIGDIVEVFSDDLELYESSIETMFESKKSPIWKYMRTYNYAECVLNIFNDDGSTQSEVPWIAMFSGNFSINKEVYLQHEGFDESYFQWGFENIDFGIKMHKAGITFNHSKKIPNFHIYHEQHRSVDDNSGTEMLMKKYEDAPYIERYIRFLESKISLAELERTSESHYERLSINYISDKLGARYRFKDYERYQLID